MRDPVPSVAAGLSDLHLHIHRPGGKGVGETTLRGPPRWRGGTRNRIQRSTAGSDPKVSIGDRRQRLV